MKQEVLVEEEEAALFDNTNWCKKTQCERCMRNVLIHTDNTDRGQHLQKRSEERKLQLDCSQNVTEGWSCELATANSRIKEGIKL